MYGEPQQESSEDFKTRITNTSIVTKLILRITKIVLHSVIVFPIHPYMI